MKWFAVKIIFLLSLAMFVNYSIGEGATRIAIVGDTGTGERAYHPGFMAVQKAMREKNMPMLYCIWAISFTSPIFFLNPVQTDISKKSKRLFPILTR